MDAELLRKLAFIWMLENETEQARHGHKAVKYVIRQLWPELASELDRCSLETVKERETDGK